MRDKEDTTFVRILRSFLPWPEVMEEVVVVVQVFFAGSKGKQLKMNLK
jgi:hypothetical protein